MKIRGSWYGALMLIFFLFAFHAQCHPHQQQLNVESTKSRAYSLTDTTLDESKRGPKICKIFHCPQGYCYCCMDQSPKPKCYDTLDECRAACRPFLSQKHSHDLYNP
ncbi:hypothetical protein SORBI_3001G270600 [Sorghum bicolor]|uniref:Embryo surrounding factor 1 brassicaceae domain-containing protein n=1 Tax=Sorghum bicolor TaxID=4558 RepID=A0A1B6QLB2_SORBI|nr:hypothetical protein SORBI_3001G270600 [Sorghum bicolor]